MNWPLLAVEMATTLCLLSRQATVAAAEIQSILVGEPAPVADNSGDTCVVEKKSTSECRRREARLRWKHLPLRHASTDFAGGT
jgi:hypothetical protein